MAPSSHAGCGWSRRYYFKTQAGQRWGIGRDGLSRDEGSSSRRPRLLRKPDPNRTLAATTAEREAANNDAEVRRDLLRVGQGELRHPPAFLCTAEPRSPAARQVDDRMRRKTVRDHQRFCPLPDDRRCDITRGRVVAHTTRRRGRFERLGNRPADVDIRAFLRPRHTEVPVLGTSHLKLVHTGRWSRPVDVVDGLVWRGGRPRSTSVTGEPSTRGQGEQREECDTNDHHGGAVRPGMRPSHRPAFAATSTLRRPSGQMWHPNLAREAGIRTRSPPPTSILQPTLRSVCCTVRHLPTQSRGSRSCV